MSVQRPLQMTNCVWPLQRPAGRWKRATLLLRADAAVRHYVRTQRGSIRWAPTYGWIIEQLRTQALQVHADGTTGGADDGSIDAAESMLVEGLAFWVPYVLVTAVKLVAPPTDETLQVTVFWRLQTGVANARSALALEQKTTVKV